MEYFAAHILKKYKHNIKRLLKPNGLKHTYFLKPSLITAFVLEDAVLDRLQVLKINQLLLKYIKRRGSLQFPCLKLKPRTEKPVGIRMGKGKGSVSN
jgi:ribosomal protein L16/L10AE